MKKTIAIAFLFLTAVCSAQSDFLARWQRQVRNVGYGGVGVETILDAWEAAEPDNLQMMEGRVNYHFDKNRTTRVISRSTPRYLGSKPLMTMRDTSGAPVYYYEDTVFDDEQFALCQKYIDRCIASYPYELVFRENKISTLLAYEKESPDLAYAELVSLVNLQKGRPSWTLMGEPVDEQAFIDDIMQYCYSLYSVGSAKGYECFRNISELMLKLYPKNADFTNNLGSYHLVAAGNPKQAVKYYKKTLKLDPDNEAALKNIRIAEARMKAAGR